MLCLASLSYAGGPSSASAATSSAPGDITAVNRVIFMLQENRSFDTYLGMINPYRMARGWNIGDDKKEYDVDGYR